MEEEVSPAEEMKKKGNDEFKKKNFPQAIEYYEEAIKMNSEEPLYYNNKAAAEIEMKEYDKAHETINKAILLFDDGICKDYVRKAKVYARKGSLLAKQERYAEAIEAYDKSFMEDGSVKTKEELRKLRKLQK